jgi:competence protein ComEC
VSRESKVVCTDRSERRDDPLGPNCQQLTTHDSRLPAHPLVPVAVAFCAGILLGMTIPGLALATVGAAIGLPATLWARRGHGRSAAVLAAFAAAGTWRSYLAATPAPDDVSRFIGAGYVTVRGVVAGDVDASGDSLLCAIAVERVTTPDGLDHTCSGRVTARLRRGSGTASPDYGDRVEARGPLEKPQGARNPGAFDYGAYLAHLRVFAALTVKRPSGWRILPASPAPADWPARFASRCRASLLSSLNDLLPPAEAGLLAGIMLGTRVELPPQLNDDFTVTGTAHILASSGMNVAMVAVLLRGLCGLLRVARRSATALTLIALAFYTLMAGAKPSILRADLMATLFLGGSLLDRKANGPNALAAAALIVLAFEPGYLFDAGFQLSFVVVACILAAAPVFEKIRAWYGPPRYPTPGRGRQFAARFVAAIAEAAALSAVAQIASLPLIAQHFNQVSVVGVLANALIVPPLLPLMAAGFAAWLGALVWPFAAQVVATVILGPMLACLIGAARTFALMPGAVLYVPSPGWTLIALYYAVFGAVMWRLRRRTVMLPIRQEKD